MMPTEKTDPPLKGTELRLSNIISGAKEVMSDDDRIQVDGVLLGRNEVVDMAQEVFDVYKRVHDLRKELARMIEKREELERRKAKEVIQKLQIGVAGRYGFGREYAVFGFTVRKQARKLTSGEQLTRTERYRATWNARHPVGGKAQAKKIKGVLPEPAPSPSDAALPGEGTAPSAPSAA